MKTRTLSTRIDDDLYDWLCDKARQATLSRIICDILREKMESEKRKKK